MADQASVVTPRRECTAPLPSGKPCQSHVYERRGRWFCPTCGEMRSLATTVEVRARRRANAPPKEAS